MFLMMGNQFTDNLFGETRADSILKGFPKKVDFFSYRRLKVIRHADIATEELIIGLHGKSRVGGNIS